MLKEFSDVTGGRYFFVKKAGQLAGTYQRIAEELRAQYYLTYSTTNEDWDGHWIKIKVESERPGREDPRPAGLLRRAQRDRALVRLAGVVLRLPRPAASSRNPSGGIGCSVGISSNGVGS